MSGGRRIPCPDCGIAVAVVTAVYPVAGSPEIHIASGGKHVLVPTERGWESAIQCPRCKRPIRLPEKPEQVGCYTGPNT